MSATGAAPAQDTPQTRLGYRRFDRVGVTSVFGDPLNPRTWSGAPRNLADALVRLGVAVEGIHPRLGLAGKLGISARNFTRGAGWPISGEQLFRSELSRRHLAQQVAQAAQRRGLRHVLHTGTFDLPPIDQAHGVRHYLYCDHTWALARAHHIEAQRYTQSAQDSYEMLERRALTGLEHIFTFGRYVRDNLVDHYGVPADRVTAVGSGMGRIISYDGPKNYARPKLLFVAKHYFAAKGGPLLIEALRIALPQRPDLRLSIVADESARRRVPIHPALTFHSGVTWEVLQGLFRDATLLVQPMLNDPWGQVYLEALASRTPVMGLRRHGLPEITRDGRYGFLVDQADPLTLADAILEAVDDPQRLARMAHEGQQHVVATYGWDAVARRVALT